MLSRFELKNIALVDSAEIEFTDGVNILSGETGSGKSVILDSINFVLGAKADRSMIRYGTDECSATATFILPDDHPVHEVLKELEVDEDTLIISRKYNSDGRGSIKVNGTSVTANMLRRITSRLVDVHGQSEHFSLLKEEEQLAVIDAYKKDETDRIKAGLAPLIARLGEINSSIRRLGGNESERAVRQDILTFQINEIKSASLEEGEEENLLRKHRIFVNAEKIINALGAARSAISDENGAADVISSAYHSVMQIASLDADYDKLGSRLEAAAIELDDISESIADILGALEYDEEEAARIDERLNLINKLKKKYGSDIGEILRFLASAEDELDKLVNSDKVREKLTAEKAKIKHEIYRGIVELSKVRRDSAKEFADGVVGELHELGMAKARFEVGFSDPPSEEELPDGITQEGTDAVEFMFSANLGEPLKPLAKIISGGEISRFMLAVRTQTAAAHSVSTFIFDEIDAGISGVIASVVAEKFVRIALDKQIIAITHLPQIACMADNALLIEKKEEDGKTRTVVRNISGDERVGEITRLVGGSSSSAAAVAHAGEMIAAAEAFKKKLRANR